MICNRFERAQFWRVSTIPAITACTGVAAPAATPIDGLLGTWAGSGQVRYESGATEGIRCNAYYTGGGQRLQLAIRCKNARHPMKSVSVTFTES
jgi:hypothetical protein